MRIEWRWILINHWWQVIDNIEVNDEQPATFSVQPVSRFPDLDTATVSWQLPLKGHSGGEGKKDTGAGSESSDGRYDVDLAALKRATTYRYRIALLKMFVVASARCLNSTPSLIFYPVRGPKPSQKHRLAAYCLKVTADQNGYLLILGPEDGALASSPTPDRDSHCRS